jgi:hypothetical protein
MLAHADTAIQAVDRGSYLGELAMALKLTWYSDLKAESDLRRMAVPFEVAAIPFSKIDLKESQINGARLRDAIREHKVEDYQQGMRNGDTFPMPIVHKTPTGYVILSGNQRCEAVNRLIKNGDLPKSQEIQVYLVDTKDRLLLEIIARSANVAHGEGDSKADRIQQAIYCVRSLGLAVKDAAKTFLVAESTINHNMRAEEQRNRLMRAGIEAQHVPNGCLEPLAKLEYDEPAQLKLGSLIAQHQPPTDRIKQVVAAVAKQSSAPARLGKIREFEKELSVDVHSRNGHAKQQEQSKVPLRPRRDKLIGLLNRLVTFLDSENDGEAFTDLEQLQITSAADRDLALTLCRKLRYRLGVIGK